MDRNGDGLLRNRRGFVCPPHLTTYQTPSGTTAVASDIHLPGEYILRAFTPTVAFTQTDRFTSWGENTSWVGFDLDPGADPRDIPDQMMFSIGDHEAAARIHILQAHNHAAGWQWVTDLTITETDIGGHPATVTQFSGDCPEEDVPDQDWPRCSFEETGPFGWFGWRVFDGQWTATVVVDLPDGLFTIIAYDWLGDRGYWTETVEPILDSIEFIDP